MSLGLCAHQPDRRSMAFDNQDLQGKVALVTGATSGIGLETAAALAGPRRPMPQAESDSPQAHGEQTVHLTAWEPLCTQLVAPRSFWDAAT